MEAIFVTGIVFSSLYGIFKLLIQRKERLMLIDKLGENIGEKDIRLLSEGFTQKNFFSTLTIGCLLLGVGLGFLLGFCLVESFIFPKMQLVSERDHAYYHLRDTATIIYFASVFVMGGLSLIAAYLIERKKLEKNSGLTAK